ncbi:MAG: VOC family protein [Gammaproteobacteria bacterium]|nr:VOC family protein [Gammaproteobacteria bacterium]
MIRIIGFNHVSLLVTDTQRALGFYHGVLNLPVIHDRPELGFPGAWLDAGNGQQIHLLEIQEKTTGELPEHGDRDRHFAMDITDLDAAITALDTADIDYTLSRSGRRALFCRDPDGNAIELVEV